FSRDWSSDVCSSDLVGLHDPASGASLVAVSTLVLMSVLIWVCAQKVYRIEENLKAKSVLVENLNQKLERQNMRLQTINNELESRSEERRVGNDCRCQ